MDSEINATGNGNKRKITDTETTNRNSPHKLLINWLIPEIIPIIIPTIDLTTADGVAASGGTLHARRTFILKETITDAVRRGARVFKHLTLVKWKDTDRTITHDRKTVVTPPD